ncbi:hypothetical protein [Dyadobacter psychrotolerans]|uniref:Uncharacterized protein n=1 Tax=Dyadobacter psychrotolerans TaxID=2541721 RepID=A0A4R5DQS1_9BACT|nr:hypothetical protein [Dyadobacter psychrotolerans]TDE16746.1 hypothetical protein E0F88_11010 [Dyadobacter psychrotolerans]
MAKPSEKKVMFDGSEGEIIFSSAANTLKSVHQKKKSEITKGNSENYVEAEFFGLNTFNKLMESYKGQAVGFRVYYGSRWEEHQKDEVIVREEGKGKKTSRLIIVPVDAYGRDLASPIGIKDNEGSPSALANGPLCPHKCAPPEEDTV